MEKDYSWALLTLDCITITVLFALSIWLRYDESLTEAWSWRVFAVLLWTPCVGIYLIGGYRQRTVKKSLSYATEHLLVGFATFAVSFIAIYVFITYGQNMRAARTSVFVVLLGFPILSLLYRRMIDPYFRRAVARRCIDIIGAGPLADEIYYRLREKCWGYSIRVFDEDYSLLGQRIGSVESTPPVIEDVSLLPQMDFEALAKREAVILTRPPSELSASLRRHLLNAQHLHGLKIHTYDSYVRLHFCTEPVETLSHDWAFTEGSHLSHSPVYERLKRCMDLFLGTLLLAVLAPLMTLIGLLVKLTSRGPVFFVQERVGQGERKFQLIKFRSMAEGSEVGNAYTEKNDLRITRIGAFLRRTHIDELPQLFNVLRGDMSLVGPRAEWRRLVDHYESTIPHYHLRHMVKPGVTGWAQVNQPYGLSEEDDAAEKLRYDLYYVRHCSMLLDISTLLKTAYTVLFAKGR